VSHALKYISQQLPSRLVELTRHRHVPLRPSNMERKAPRGYPRQWVRATGEGSKPIVFTLRYRSRGDISRPLSLHRTKLTSSQKHCLHLELSMRTRRS
jgi:hypothetical protein